MIGIAEWAELAFPELKPEGADVEGEPPVPEGLFEEPGADDTSDKFLGA